MTEKVCVNVPVYAGMTEERKVMGRIFFYNGVKHVKVKSQMILKKLITPFLACNLLIPGVIVLQFPKVNR
jgi:hypothetical protein